MATNRVQRFSAEERAAIAEGLALRAKHYDDCANIVRDRVGGLGDEDAAHGLNEKASAFDVLRAEFKLDPSEATVVRAPGSRLRVNVERVARGVIAGVVGGPSYSGSNASEAIGGLVRSSSEVFGVDLDFGEGAWPVDLIR